eukprot:gene1734-biopygen1713
MYRAWLWGECTVVIDVPDIADKARCPRMTPLWCRTAGSGENPSSVTPDPTDVLSSSLSDAPSQYCLDSKDEQDARRSGFFCRHALKNSADSELIRPGSGKTSSLPIFCRRMSCTQLMCANGCSPVSISSTVAPRDHTSLCLPPFSPRTVSGAIQAGVPSGVPGFAPPLSGFARPSIVSAVPKSASLQMPRTVTSTFAPLTSRCTTLF